VPADRADQLVHGAQTVHVRDPLLGRPHNRALKDAPPDEKREVPAHAPLAHLDAPHDLPDGELAAGSREEIDDAGRGPREAEGIDQSACEPLDSRRSHGGRESAATYFKIVPTASFSHMQIHLQ